MKKEEFIFEHETFQEEPPTTVLGIDLLKEYLLSGGKKESFSTFIKRKKL
jgi:hypothetical protein